MIQVNSAIYQAAQSQPQYAGMGTTLVVAVFHDNRVTVGHIGDSRLYRMRGEDFQQITRDHSLLQEQIDSGLITPEQARHSQNKNLVTRAVGIDPEVQCPRFTIMRYCRATSTCSVPTASTTWSMTMRSP
jgi:serine/threonine protein phosphatase PrpC